MEFWGWTSLSHPPLLSLTKIIPGASFRSKQYKGSKQIWHETNGLSSEAKFLVQTWAPNDRNHSWATASSARGQNSPGHLGMGENACVLQARLAQLLLYKSASKPASSPPLEKRKQWRLRERPRRSSSHPLATPSFSIFILVPLQDMRLAFEFGEEYLEIKHFLSREFLTVKLWALPTLRPPGYKLDPHPQFFGDDYG